MHKNFCAIVGHSSTIRSSSKHLELRLCHQRSCQQMLGIRQSTDCPGFARPSLGRASSCSLQSKMQMVTYRQKGALPRFHDNRWVRRWTGHQVRFCYKRSTSWRRNPVRVSAPLAARRCAIVRNGFTMHRREPFDPSRRHLMKRTTNLPSLSRIAPLHGRKAGLQKRREARIRVPATDDRRKIPS